MRWVCRVVAAIFPWPSRAQRREQVKNAQAEAAESRELARAARTLTDELYALRRKNHVKEALDYLIQHRTEGTK